MPYTNLISRTNAAPLIPEEVAREVLQGVRQQSAVLQLFRRVPVGRAQQRMPVLSALPVAYWVNGDTGLKQTTELAWANKFLNIEEVAAFVPVPQNVLDDADYPIWDEARPFLEEAVGRTLDSAVFFGAGAPASFPTNVNASAAAAGNNVTEGSAAAVGGFQNDVDLVMSAVEDDGFDVTGFVATRSVRGKFRRARDANGNRLAGLNENLTDYLGSSIAYGMSGLWPAGGGAGTNVRMFALDGSQFVVGVRSDINFEVFREGVIQDATGAIVYNLMQQDMAAMRCTFRVGWQVANIINNEQPVAANRYPAGVLRY